MRAKFLIVALLCAVVGCQSRGELPPPEPVPDPMPELPETSNCEYETGADPAAPEAGWPDVTRSDGVRNVSAGVFLDCIREWTAAGADNQPDVYNAAGRRKNYRYEGHGPKQSWARVAVAFRYAQAARATSDATQKQEYYDFAGHYLDPIGTAADEPQQIGWAAGEINGPNASADWYLDRIEERLPECPWSIRHEVQAAIMARRLDQNPKHENYARSWAHMMCAYYAVTWGGQQWTLCKNELEHMN